MFLCGWKARAYQHFRLKSLLSSLDNESRIYEMPSFWTSIFWKQAISSPSGKNCRSYFSHKRRIFSCKWSPSHQNPAHCTRRSYHHMSRVPVSSRIFRFDSRSFARTASWARGAVDEWYLPTAGAIGSALSLTCFPGGNQAKDRFLSVRVVYHKPGPPEECRHEPSVS